jgi:uncharacterized membrane protein YhaH (DUF805 family)
MQQYFNFSGTAKRQEYWAVLIISIALLIIGLVLVEGGSAIALLAALGILVASLWVMLATTVRRLRDAGLNTWWLLLVFVPYVALVAQIVFGVIGSKTDG